MKRLSLLFLFIVAVLTGCGDSATGPDSGLTAGAGTLRSATGQSEGGATLTTDADDYAPGDTVRIIGAGWAPGETVDMVFNEDPADDEHPPITLTAVADEFGAFTNDEYVIDWRHLGVTFTVVATGRTSGETLQVVFTDGNLRVATSGPTFTVTVARFNGNATCSGTPNETTTGSVTLAGTHNMGVDASKSVRLTAPTSAGGASFTGWTGGTPAAASFTVVGGDSKVICVAGWNTSPDARYVVANFASVTAAATTTEVASSQNPSVSGSSVTFTATVKSGGTAIGANGAVTFKTGGTSCSDATEVQAATNLDADGTATYAASLPVGTTVVRACYGGTTAAPLYLASQGSVSQVVNPAATTTTVSLNPSALGGSQQYSDKIELQATVTPFEAGAEQLTGTVHFYVAAAGVSCGASAPSGAVGTASITDASNGVGKYLYTVDKAAGSYTVTACFYSTNSNFGNSGDTEGLAVTLEDASVLDYTAPSAVQVTAPGGTSPNVTFTFKVKETTPEDNAVKTLNTANDLLAAGDISNANVTATLVPVGSGSNLTLSCNSPAPSGPSGTYQELSFSCSRSGVPVNSYEVVITVNGGYYAGSYADVLTVFDPSLGFVTGGGKFMLGDDRVSFGLVYSFVGKDKSTPKGNLVVVRHHADGSSCRAKTNGAGAPAVSGRTATFSSSSANYTCYNAAGQVISGKGNLRLTGYVEDNGEPGTGADKFWVQVYGELLMPSPAASNAATLTGGNIQVPQPSSKK